MNMCPPKESGSQLHIFLLSNRRAKMFDEDLINVLKNEFLCYYHVDLLPDNWGDRDIITKMAHSTARRLEKKIKDRRGSLIQLLKKLILDRAHPVNATLSGETDIEWHLEDEDWEYYVSLIRRIIFELEHSSDEHFYV